MVVRDTVGAAAGCAGASCETVVTVVVVTLEVVVVDGAEVWVCAEANVATANRERARNSFRTSILDLGEIEIFLIFIYGAGYKTD